ncbi:histidine phosphatase family protein [Mucilaginibacter sp. SMC90]|uniref:histidine-type phosphatase n=1 Tax=Mucilaginibacter sp. SMC90 TaxID=2929803 RepID=UPI001FB49267|nr:histidine-type phosphatase [Mucilaginibacter sp. SMC90]UOE51542.1 histidine phosphatase family protein [Mucilaginibacter sp. SMC90]
MCASVNDLKKLLCLLLLCGLYFTASAQKCDNDFLGSKTLYKAPLARYTPAPAGYKPVFINHVGRHAARHLTKDVKTAYTYNLLQKADSAGVLTAKGKQLWQMIMLLQKVEKGNTKSISAEGRSELRGIGERMYNSYSNVFNTPKPRFNVAYTKEIRTTQSADAFLSGLKGKLKDSAMVTTYNDDVNLRFYDESPAYTRYEESGDWKVYKAKIAKAEKLDLIENDLLSQFFTPAFFKTLGKADVEKIVNDVFGFTTIVFSLQEEIKQLGLKPINLDFESLFTCAQLKSLARVDAAEDYMVKGPGLKPDGLPVIIAAPLLANFINTADQFIKTGKYNAQFRFAHAETISPFAALLGISGADKVVKDINEYDKVWSPSAVIPLSSNIQWIFYRKKGSSKYLVKILLNENEVKITGLPSLSPYYDYTVLRSFYIKKLKKHGVGLQDDMQGLLKGLKD